MAFKTSCEGNPFGDMTHLLPDDGNGQIARFLPGGKFDTTSGPWQRNGSCYQVFKFKQGEFIGKYEGDGSNAQLVARLAKEGKTYIPEEWQEIAKAWIGLVIPVTAALPAPGPDNTVVDEEELDAAVAAFQLARKMNTAFRKKAN